MANSNLPQNLWYGSSGSDRTMTPEREKLYHCSQQIAQALVETTSNERERRALYRSLEWLGVAEIRALNAEVSTDRLTSSGADLLSPTDEQTI